MTKNVKKILFHHSTQFFLFFAIVLLVPLNFPFFGERNYEKSFSNFNMCFLKFFLWFVMEKTWGIRFLNVHKFLEYFLVSSSIFSSLKSLDFLKHFQLISEILEIKTLKWKSRIYAIAMKKSFTSKYNSYKIFVFISTYPWLLKKFRV